MQPTGKTSAAPSMRRSSASVCRRTTAFIFDPDYLDIHRSDDLVMIQITWNEGRTVEQKKALYKAIADGLAAKPGIRPEDVLINLIEVKKENWSYGHGVAQYVIPPAQEVVGQLTTVMAETRPHLGD
jgi:phenylpyruvate tautomerase PptA (4-oxalocrotonate tautomerase family)